MIFLCFYVGTSSSTWDMIFFFASPQTSSSVNTTSHEQNNCMHSPTWCLCLLIVAFPAAVCARWAYCSLRITSSPAIYLCARAPFCSSGFVHTDIFVSPFSLSLPSRVDCCCVLLTRPPLSFAHALAFVLRCVSCQPCIEPRAPPSCLVARLCARPPSPALSCWSLCCYPPPPLPVMLLTRSFVSRCSPCPLSVMLFTRSSPQIMLAIAVGAS
jgi:hypothetical protein